MVGEQCGISTITKGLMEYNRELINKLKDVKNILKKLLNITG